MSNFSERLKSEIKYKGFVQKEVASKAGIQKRALDMYVGSQNSMPPADIAVKISKVLGVSVEYLVTGYDYKAKDDMDKYRTFRKMMDDFMDLSKELQESIMAMIDISAKKEREKNLDSDLEKIS